MKFLRTVSTQRLLATIVGLTAAAAGGTAIAMAAAGAGPVPPPESLAQAIRGALTRPTVRGITAEISFTNHLIDSSNLQGSDPILTGASGRLWLSPASHQARLELQSDTGDDAQVLVNQRSFWVYEPSSKTVYEGKVPQAQDRPGPSRARDRVPTIARIQSWLRQLAAHLSLSGAQPGDIGGQPAYTVSVSPKHAGGLLGSAALAWDALRGIPLRVAVYAHENSDPVLELKATHISYGNVPASSFAVTPPSDAKVVTVATAAKPGRAQRAAPRRKHQDVHGAGAVARRLPFKLVAPSQLVGLPRHSVTLLDWGGHPAALVTYGQNLGGMAVIEQVAGTAKPASASGAGGGGERRGLSLPTVSINGATGQELDTALGTMVRFDRAGVAYTVIGSVPPAAADAAARGL